MTNLEMLIHYLAPLKITMIEVNYTAFLIPVSGVIRKHRYGGS